MKSAVFNGHWYLMGGEHFKICVYYASLLATCQPSYSPPSKSHTFSGKSSKLTLPLKSLHLVKDQSQRYWILQPSSVWKRLANVPTGFCYPAVFGNRLMAVGGGSSSSTTSLYIYSSFTQSWVHTGDVPDSLISQYSTLCCSSSLQRADGCKGTDGIQSSTQK